MSFVPTEFVNVLPKTNAGVVVAVVSDFKFPLPNGGLDPNTFGLFALLPSIELVSSSTPFLLLRFDALSSSLSVSRSVLLLKNDNDPEGGTTAGSSLAPKVKPLFSDFCAVSSVDALTPNTNVDFCSFSAGIPKVNPTDSFGFDPSELTFVKLEPKVKEDELLTFSTTLLDGTPNVKPVGAILSVASALPEVTAKPPNLDTLLSISGGFELSAELPPNTNPLLLIAPGAAVLGGAVPNSTFREEVAVAELLVFAVLWDDKGFSQDTHFAASFLFFTIQTEHLTPSFMLLADQILGIFVGAAGLLSLLTADTFPPSRVFSQDTHFDASFLFFTIQIGHFFPSLMLLKDQILATGASSFLELSAFGLSSTIL